MHNIYSPSNGPTTMLPLCISHNRTAPSADPEATKRLSGENAMDKTGRERGIENRDKDYPVAVLQRRTVSSSDPDAIRALSCEQEIVFTSTE